MFEVIDVTTNDGVSEDQYINITDKKYVAQPDFTELVTTKFTLVHTKTRSIFNVAVFKLLIRGRIHNHLCLSTQLGCSHACTFCVSGTEKFVANLTHNEICEQYNIVQKYYHDKIDTVLFMGVGEPLDNYMNLLRATHIFHKRQILMSLATIAKPSAIMRMLAEKQILPINMIWASIHSFDQSKRSMIMPTVRKYSLNDTISVLNNIANKLAQTDLWCNYMIIPGFNDTLYDIDLINKFLGTSSRLNLMLTIPNNIHLIYHLIPRSERLFTTHDLYKKCVERAAAMLDKIKIPGRITLFQAAGRNVNAGCGEFIFKSI